MYLLSAFYTDTDMNRTEQKLRLYWNALKTDCTQQKSSSFWIQFLEKGM